MLRSRYMTPFPPCTSFVWDNVPEKVTPSALAAAAATSGGLGCQGHRRGPHYESNKEPQSPPGRAQYPSDACDEVLHGRSSMLVGPER